MFLWALVLPSLGSTVMVTSVEGFPVVPTVGLSLGWVVTAWFVWRLLTGKLMTLGQHTEQVTVIRETYQRQVDEVSHDRGEWRTESRIKDSTITELTDQIRGLLTSIAESVTATMDAIKDNSREKRGGSS